LLDKSIMRKMIRIKISGDLRGPKSSKIIEPENPPARFSVFFYRHNRELKFRVCELLGHK